MKKSILNLGKTLNKVEQKSINGGTGEKCWLGYKYGIIDECGDCVDPARPYFPSC